MNLENELAMTIKSLIIIPAYKPNNLLVELTKNLQQILSEQKRSEIKILIISDGNSDQTNEIFNNPAFEQAEVIYHAVNCGKGRALKSALNHALVHYPEAVAFVTADADGQHTPKDIIRLLDAAVMNPQVQLSLGYREFEEGVPLKSSFGNKATAFIFKYYIGLGIKDTQTGLRALSRSAAKEVITLAGEKYEYETNMLLLAKSNGWVIQELKIETVYIDQNRGSHFNPITDSMRIYFLIFRFAGSSIISSLVDFLAFQSLINSSFTIMQSTFGSRFISGWINFGLNKKMVFKSTSNPTKSIIRYWALVVVLGFISSKLIEFLATHDFNILASKLVVETTLFIASFSIQKEFIFKSPKATIIEAEIE